ncbi:MAG: hypothetical protein ACYDH3_10215, partial [Candidatus Aminicenantales bacterium]
SLRNFLGLGFLSRGFTAAYRRDDMGEFSLFIVDAGDSAAAGETLEKLIAHFSPAGRPGASTDAVVRFKDPYLGNMLVVPAGRFLCGATKIRDGSEKLGETIVLETAKAIGGK